MDPHQITLARPPAGLRFDMPVAPENRVFALARDTATITVFDIIGLEVTAARIADALRQIGNRPVTVLINSGGGDYWEGVAIYNLLRGHSQPVTIQVVGIARSAASVIAMAGASIEMARNSEIMIHNAWVIAAGDAQTMATAASYLAQCDRGIAEIYALRSGQSEHRVAQLMEADTYMTPQQALEMGFADKLLDRDADRKPSTASAKAPQSKGDLEAGLRQLGFSKSIAARAAAGGFPAITGNELDGVDVDQVAARVDAFTQTIEKWR